MRKRSKTKLWLDKADRALQDWYRKIFAGNLCEGCGIRKFYCMHHHLPKSRSNAGRYFHDNLIFICKFCHDEISFNGGAQIIAKYSTKRGEIWVEEMDKLKKVRRSPFGKKELEAIIKKYGGSDKN